jgi:hypothetical protein
MSPFRYKDYFYFYEIWQENPTFYRIFVKQYRIMNYLDFEIDKLTHSIENVVTGDSFPTKILPLTKADLHQINKKNGWKFNWKGEFNDPDKEVYKLTIVANPTVIQGLVSISIDQGFMEMPNKFE